MGNMSDLFKKLNVLVKTALNDALGEVSPEKLRERIASMRAGSGLEGEVVQLRQKINDALAFEDGLQKRVTELSAEVATWDAQADAALNKGNDVNARYAVEQMKRAEQRLAMAESDLREHRLVTQELISRVNMLDAAVADAKRAEAEKQVAAPPPPRAAEPVQTVAAQVPSLGDVLRDAREKITQMSDLIAAQAEVSLPTPTAEASAPVDEQQVDDDLAARRQRLSSKPKQQ
jgi:phage shock protein A